MSESILYYPNKDIRDKSWLYTAVLYWDEICSIVPNYEYDYSEDLQILFERGIYRPIQPADVFYSDGYRSKEVDVEKFEKEVIKRFIKASKNGKYAGINAGDNRSDFIHASKFPESFMERLKASSIEFYEIEDTIEFNSAYSDIYMRALAEFLAESYDGKMVIGTDSKSDLDQLYQPAKKRKEKNAVISLNILDALPVPSQQVRLEKIVDFKGKRADEFSRMKEQIKKLEINVGECKTQKQIQKAIEDFRKKWEQEQKSTQKMFMDEGIEYGLINMSTLLALTGGVPGILDMISGVKAGSYTGAEIAISTGTIIGINAMVTFRKYRKMINEQREGAFAYLFSAHKSRII